MWIQDSHDTLRIEEEDLNPVEAAIQRVIWDVDVSAAPQWKAAGIRVLRIAHAVARDALDGQLTLRAMSLVYTTLLSLVPLLAVGFSVLKGFGVHNQIEPLLLRGLAPLGDQAHEITAKTIGFVENMRVGVLGSIGLLILIYTVVSLVQKIEGAFNYTWHSTQTRSLGQRFSNYLSVITIGPVLMFGAMGLMASIASTALFQQLLTVPFAGAAVAVLGRLLPYGLVIGAFAFVYVFVPNTRVSKVSALIGAAVAGGLWEFVGWVFASYIASSGNYPAIYSGLSVLIFFMIWVYVSWLILLLGASIAFYHQHPEHLTPRRGELRLSSRLKERLALSVAMMIGRDYLHGRPSWTLERFARRLALPMDVVERVLAPLERRELILRTADDPPAYVPARALETLRLKDFLDAVREADEGPNLRPAQLAADPPIDEVLTQLERAAEDALGNRTLRDLARTAEAER